MTCMRHFPPFQSNTAAAFMCSSAHSTPHPVLCSDSGQAHLSLSHSTAPLALSPLTAELCTDWDELAGTPEAVQVKERVGEADVGTRDAVTAELDTAVEDNTAEDADDDIDVVVRVE